MKTVNRKSLQGGAGLMEVLVAMSISLVVTASMIAMMSNSLSTTARVINMTKLTDDLRVALQMMTRDVRRTSYNADAIYCYGNEDCFTDGTLSVTGDIVFFDGPDADSLYDCFTFRTDRGLDNYTTSSPAGGFRHVPVGDVGVIQMWTGGESPDCGAAAGADGWVEVTDPQKMNITAFSIDDSLSYTENVLQDINGNIINLRVRKLRLRMDGALVLDSSIVRQVEDVISVRNNLLL